MAPGYLFSHSLIVLSLVLYLTPWASAHVAAWHKGMYCLNGTTSGVDDMDTNEAAQPLYQLTESDWWFHHFDKCDEFPPSEGDFLELPANGFFTVELAVNRAFTTLSYRGTRTGIFGDGDDHPEGLGSDLPPGECITNPNIHTQNETMAAGTVFAISYTSSLQQVTKENLVVFTVLYHTPWYRVATYSVPNLPVCPPAGCICAWGWVPNGCGIPNMYMLPFRCKVVGHTGNAAVAPGRPPVWCEDNKGRCVQGAKQMVFWNQLDGNNVNVTGFDLAGDPKSPSYNAKMGFENGAQKDIFMQPGSASTTYITPGPSATPTSPATSTATPSSLALPNASAPGYLFSFCLSVLLTISTL